MKTRRVAILKVLLPCVLAASATFGAGSPGRSPAARKKAPGPSKRVAAQEAALETGSYAQIARRVLAGVPTPAGPAALDALAAAMARRPDRAGALLAALRASESPLAPAAAAELLWRIAMKGRLTPRLAAALPRRTHHPERTKG